MSATTATSDVTASSQAAPASHLSVVPDADAQVTPDYTEDTLSPLDHWTNDNYDAMESWTARDERYETFVANWGNDALMMEVYNLYFADMELNLASLENPAKVTGDEFYDAQKLLVDVRHLREVNRANDRAGRGHLVARRLSSPRAKNILWGIGTVEIGQPGDTTVIVEIVRDKDATRQVSKNVSAAAAYAHRLDKLALSLARMNAAMAAL